MKETEVHNQIQHTFQESSFDRNSEVNEELDKDVVRYTLESYLGSYVSSSDKDKKQTAVEKILNLKKENFDELVNDIINDIHRRSNMAYDNQEKPMRNKLTRLRDEKFKNLVYDVLQVFNFRHCKKPNTDIKDEIENLSKLISILKVEDESNDNILNENNRTLKFKHFIEYIKNYHNDKTVEYMENYIQESLDQDTDDNFEILFNYKMLLHKLDNSKYKNLKEYKIYKSNIRRIEEMNVEKKVKRSLIDKEYMNISELLLSKQYHFEEVCIKNDINHLINLFSKYNNNEHINKSDESSFNLFAKNIARIVYNIVNKANMISYTNKNIVADLKNIADRSLECRSCTEYDRFILEVTNKIRDLLENMQK
ncbi:hypothetical protein NBO_857g0001 [Nosema bombycis CQ1]|uniref:GIT Spa2 homology (SHD) domain-containing protein n=1 Tax=Nosema bombycis (strain CQ1 / CVCC 102059) TaxID=578461 RepID=R0KNN0_NOSB1|nr:hypothetical protein NBO_857g0001 [Nosema bombycis CQ1]|eukprot:EOB11777.1 hypothetical protein NBO_857g0001 [Nosema bombycis CQ1]